MNGTTASSRIINKFTIIMFFLNKYSKETLIELISTMIYEQYCWSHVNYAFIPNSLVPLAKTEPNVNKTMRNK